MSRCVWLNGLVFCVCALAVAATAGPQTQGCAVEAADWAPRGSAKTARPTITVVLTSTCGAAIDLSSIQMTVDDEAVMAKAEGAGPKITVSYTPESALVEEEDHTVVVRVRDVKGTAGEKTWTFHVGDTYSR